MPQIFDSLSTYAKFSKKLTFLNVSFSKNFAYVKLVFCKKDVLKNFANFTRKHLCCCPFLIKLRTFRKKRLQYR